MQRIRLPFGMMNVRTWALVLVLLLSSSLHAMELRDNEPLVGVYGGTGNRTVEKAIETGVDVLFPPVTWYEPNDFLGRKMEQIRPHSMTLYPSLAVAYDGSGDKKNPFAEAHPEYWEKRRDGRLIDSGTQVGLSFGYAEVRAHKVRTITDLVRRTGVDGVLLDYCRYFGSDAGYSDPIVNAFKEKHNKDPFEISPEDPDWIRHRASYVTMFVEELRTSLNQLEGNVEILACVNPDPVECLHNVGQDWATWVDKGLVDGVVTMIYERDTNNTLKSVQIANAAIRGRVPHMPMIAPYGDNLTTPAMLKEGSHKCLATGTRAVAYYRDDAIFNHDLWDSIEKVAQWDLDDIERQPVNYLLNSGFENELQRWAIGYGEGIGVVDKTSRTGDHSLRMSFPGKCAARQIIDRGFLPGKKALAISGWLIDAAMADDGRIHVDIHTNRRGGKENQYRVSIERTGEKDWRSFSAVIPDVPSDDLKFIIVSVAAEASGGELLVDDLAVNLTDAVQATPNVSTPEPSEAAATSGGKNIVRGQIVTGSSFWENGREYDNAVDGDLSSDNLGKGASWHSQRPPFDQWIKIYLPRTHTISRIRMLNSSANHAYRTREYKIEVSENDQDYTQVASGVLPNDGETWTEIKVKPTKARYIKFTGVTGYTTTHAVGLKEIEVYGP